MGPYLVPQRVLKQPLRQNSAHYLAGQSSAFVILQITRLKILTLTFSPGNRLTSCLNVLLEAVFALKLSAK